MAQMRGTSDRPPTLIEMIRARAALRRSGFSASPPFDAAPIEAFIEAHRGFLEGDVEYGRKVLAEHRDYERRARRSRRG